MILFSVIFEIKAHYQLLFLFVRFREKLPVTVKYVFFLMAHLIKSILKYIRMYLEDATHSTCLSLSKINSLKELIS